MKILSVIVLFAMLLSSCGLDVNGIKTEGATDLTAVTLATSLTSSCQKYDSNYPQQPNGLDNCDGSTYPTPTINIKWKDGGVCSNLSSTAKTIVSGTIGSVSNTVGNTIDATQITASAVALTYTNSATTIPFGSYCMMVHIDFTNNGMDELDPVILADVTYSSDVAGDLVMGAVSVSDVPSSTVGGGSSNATLTADWVKATTAHINYWNN